jgi:hypothetical protein
MRAYGITNAVPYASAPAVGAAGDTYWNTAEKVLYVSDGTAWLVAGAGAVGPPSGPAGGSLKSTYPNPGIADLAVGTLQLADGAVTKVKMAVGASVRQIVPANMPTNYTLAGGNAWTDVTTVAITTSGGTVVVLVSGGWWLAGTAGVDNFVLTGLARDQVTPNIVGGERHYVTGGTGSVIMPLPALIGVDTPTAGAHTYHVVGFCPTGANLKTAGTWSGVVWLVELA